MSDVITGGTQVQPALNDRQWAAYACLLLDQNLVDAAGLVRPAQLLARLTGPYGMAQAEAEEVVGEAEAASGTTGAAKVIRKAAPHIVRATGPGEGTTDGETATQWLPVEEQRIRTCAQHYGLSAQETAELFI